MRIEGEQGIEKRMLELLISDRGLALVAAGIEEQTGCSVLVTGADYRYLAVRVHEGSAGQPAEKYFLEEQKDSYLSVDTLKYITKHRIAQELEKSGICRHYIQPLDTYALICPVRIRGIQAAELVLMQQERTILEEAAEYLPLFAGTLSLELQKEQKMPGFRHTSASAFLLRLLKGFKPHREAAEEILAEAGLTLKDRFYVAVMESETGEIQGRDAKMLVQLLSRFMKEIEYTLYEGRLVVFFNFSRENSLSRHMMKSLRQFAIKNRLTVGISNVFTDFFDFRRFYEQACRAIHLGMQHLKNSSLTPVYLYYDYSYCDLLENCSDSVNLLDIVYPPLLDLLEYDRQKESDLMDTLFQYLLHNANTQLTAQSMPTHKNTILYRLNLIKEIIQNDLSAGENLFIINLSLRIMTHLRLFVPKKVTDKYDMASPNLDVEE